MTIVISTGLGKPARIAAKTCLAVVLTLGVTSGVYGESSGHVTASTLIEIDARPVFQYDDSSDAATTTVTSTAQRSDLGDVFHAAVLSSGLATATASTSAGALHLFASAGVVASPAFASLPYSSISFGGGAEAELTDTFSVLATGTSLTSGYLIMNADVAGQLHPTGAPGLNVDPEAFEGQADYSVRLAAYDGASTRLSPSLGYNRRSGIFYADPDGQAFFGSAPGLLQLPVPIVFGKPITIDLLADAGASGVIKDSGAEAGGLANFADTVSWKGMQLYDSLGHALTNFTAISPVTGFDYAQAAPADTPAVPEPATWAMMIAGLGFSGVAMRWRRRPLAFG